MGETEVKWVIFASFVGCCRKGNTPFLLMGLLGLSKLFQELGLGGQVGFVNGLFVLEEVCQSDFFF